MHQCIGRFCKDVLSVALRVCGSYADMHAGLPSEACKDFSGGVHKTYELKDAHDYGHDEELWLSLQSAARCNSMICCGTSQKGVSKCFLFVFFFLNKRAVLKTKLILVLKCVFSGQAGEQCSAHWTGGRACLFCHRSLSGNVWEHGRKNKGAVHSKI